MSLKELRDTLDYLKSELQTADGEVKLQMEASYKSTLNAVTRLTESISQPGSSPVATYKSSQKLKALEVAIMDVPMFNGTGDAEVERFCGRLSQLYHLLVENGDKDLAKDFIKLATMRLSQPVYQHIIQSQSDISEWDKFSNVIRTTYGPKLNPTQLLNKLYDLDFSDESKFSLFAMKIHETIRVGYGALNEQWKKAKNVQTDITGEATAQYFGMCFFVQVLKNKDYQLHKDIIKDLESCLDANQLASKCQWFRDRVGPSAMSTTLFGNAFGNENRRNNTKQHQRDKKAKDAKDWKRDKRDNDSDEGDKDTDSVRDDENRRGKKKPPKKGKHSNHKGGKKGHNQESRTNVCQNQNIIGNVSPNTDASVFTSASFQ